MRTGRLCSAQGQNRGQLPRSNQRVTRGGTVLSVEGVGLGTEVGWEGISGALTREQLGTQENIFRLELTCEDEGGGYRGPQHGVAAPVSLALQCSEPD